MSNAPIALRIVGDAALWCLWLPLDHAERAGYGECQSVAQARAAGEHGAWIAFPTYAHALCVWQQVRLQSVAGLN